MDHIPLLHTVCNVKAKAENAQRASAQCDVLRSKYIIFWHLLMAGSARARETRRRAAAPGRAAQRSEAQVCGTGHAPWDRPGRPDNAPCAPHAHDLTIPRSARYQLPRERRFSVYDATGVGRTVTDDAHPPVASMRVFQTP
jgi:hypothetical protein